MIFIDCEQGSDEWRAARAGVITASMASTALETKAKGDPTQKCLDYADRLAIERISGAPSDEGYNSWQMQRGQDEEPAGRMKYETTRRAFVSESGLVLTDDRRFGYSTDGFIGSDGMIEIKSLVGARAVMAIWRDGDLSDYMHQMQFGLWITGRKWCDFVMWCPQLESVGRDLFVQRISRDEAFIEKMEAGLMAFMKRVDANEAALRFGAAERIAA